MTVDVQTPEPVAPEAVRRKRDVVPWVLVPALALLALPLVGSASSWLTLTFAGLAMGLMIFVMASGLTLTFGLMDVLNFGHGAFIAVGALHLPGTEGLVELFRKAGYTVTAAN